MILFVGDMTFLGAILFSWFLPPSLPLPPYLILFFKRRSPHHLRDNRGVGGNGVLQGAEGRVEDEGVDQVS